MRENIYVLFILLQFKLFQNTSSETQTITDLRISTKLWWDCLTEFILLRLPILKWSVDQWRSSRTYWPPSYICYYIYSTRSRHCRARTKILGLAAHTTTKCQFLPVVSKFCRLKIKQGVICHLSRPRWIEGYFIPIESPPPPPPPRSKRIAYMSSTLTKSTLILTFYLLYKVPCWQRVVYKDIWNVDLISLSRRIYVRQCETILGVSCNVYHTRWKKISQKRKKWGMKSREKKN